MPYGPPRRGWYLEMTYPIDEDSAVASIYRDALQYADVWLEGIDLTAVGEARVANARVAIERHPPAWLQIGHAALVHPEGTPWDIDEAEDRAQIERAAARLLENEKGREPDEP